MSETSGGEEDVDFGFYFFELVHGDEEVCGVDGVGVLDLYILAVDAASRITELSYSLCVALPLEG